MTVEVFNLIINLMMLFLICALFCCIFKKGCFSDDTGNKRTSVSQSVFDAFFGKEDKMSDEEKRDREILDMIERYDGKSVRRKEELNR